MVGMWRTGGRHRARFCHWKTVTARREEPFERVRQRYPNGQRGTVKLLCLRKNERALVTTDLENFDESFASWTAAGYRVTILRVV
jgi:hypothetical protein